MSATTMHSPSLCLEMPRAVAIPVAGRPALSVVPDGDELSPPPDRRRERAAAAARSAAAWRALDDAVRESERAYAALVQRREACERRAAADRAILRSAGYLAA